MKTLIRLAAAIIAMMPVAAAAQTSAYSVKGRVTDEAGEGESFATYRIYSLPDTVKSIAINTTDSAGFFERALPRAGKYSIVINSVGKHSVRRSFELSAKNPTADLGTMTAGTSTEMLREVSVTAQRPLVTKEIDRVGYDVQADEDSKTNTVLEMLRKVPMVSVDADGTIKVNGSTNFKVYKDGRPNQAFSSNGKDIFAAIPASMIKRIEVITEPGAKYDAEGVGAILNIVTMENTKMAGAMGSAGLRAESTNDFIPGGNLWLTAQVNKVTFSMYAGGGYNGSRRGKSASNTESFYKESGNVYRSESAGRSKNYFMWFGGEASYDLDSLNLFTLELNGFTYAGKSHSAGNALMANGAGEPIYSYDIRTNSPRFRYLNFDGTFNYQHTTKRKGENITLSYAISTNNDVTRDTTWYDNLVNFPLDYNKSYTNYDLQLMEHTFQADWTRPFANIHTLEVGGKYILRRNHSDNTQHYGEQDPMNTKFTHLTDIGALYTQYSVRLGKWNLRAGLRYEYSRLKAEFKGKQPDFSSELNDFVPSAAVSWQASNSSSFTFNYAARINRPGIEYLNPVVQETPTTKTYGNPGLNSARHNSFKLTYMLIKPKFNFNISTQYELSNDGIVNDFFVDDEGIINNTYINAGHTRRLDINMFMQWSISSKTQFMINGGVGNTRYSQNGMKLSRWGYRGFGRLQQRLPWNITFEIGTFVMGPWVSSVYSYSKAPGMQGVYLMSALRKSFLKEDRLTVSINAHNPIGRSSREFITHTVNGDVLGTSTQRNFNQRSIGLSISYRFGSINAQVKKTNKTIQNDDLVGGASGNQSQSGSGEGGM